MTFTLKYSSFKEQKLKDNIKLKIKSQVLSCGSSTVTVTPIPIHAASHKHPHLLGSMNTLTHTTVQAQGIAA